MKIKWMSKPEDHNYLRARCNKLVVDAIEIPSVCAASFDVQPRTSLRSKTALCRGGRCWIAATKASRTVSRISYLAAGPGAVSAIPFSAKSGYGPSHEISVEGLPSGICSVGPPKSWGKSRLRTFRLSIASRQTFVVIR